MKTYQELQAELESILDADMAEIESSDIDIDIDWNAIDWNAIEEPPSIHIDLDA